jgi:REP element-mobilizing transposase RayT
LNRLHGYDYSQKGYYFLTICTKNRIDYFGIIENGRLVLNEYGEIAKKCWLEIPEHFPNAILDEWIIMPNHIHGIVIIFEKKINDAENKIAYEKNVRDKNGDKNFCLLPEIPWQTKLSKSISSIIRGFKIGVTKYCHENNVPNFQWQKSFYDHIIRNEQALINIRKYIQNNPIKWELDKDRNHLKM